ncbi:MAG TPA: hypothetical protein DDZ53_09700 [Firmicutes bacterium]|nr:hypothetical protein [Bacillota bacterium]
MIQFVFLLSAYIITRNRVRVNVAEFMVDFRQFCPLWLIYFLYSTLITAILRYLIFIKGFNISILISAIIYFILPIGSIALYLKLRAPSYLTTAIQKNRVEMFLTVAGFLLNTVAQVFYTLELRQGHIVSIYDKNIIYSSTWIWALILRVLIFGMYVALVEELFFRVALFSVLKKIGIQDQKVVMYLCSLVFGLLHLIPVVGQQTPYLLVIANAFLAAIIGVFLGHVYLWRENLIHIVFLHWLINLANDVVIELLTVLLTT